MPACPQEDTFLAFVGGSLGAEDSRRLEAHVDTCSGCRELLAEVGRSLMPEGTLPSAAMVAEGDPLPASIGRYAVRGAIGAGGMGVVYAAHDPELDRKVALKLVRPGRGSSSAKNVRDRVLREAQAMAKLSHTNVIAVYDVGTYEGSVFLAMELVEGTTLAEASRKEPDWRKKLPLLLQAGEGLAAAHAAGLIHRDFKPDNVLVGHDGRVRVCDFGLARAATDEAPAASSRRGRHGVPLLGASLTSTGTVVGTPAYMAPEQLDDVSDARSDVFSFSVALYEALYGERPFGGGTLPALMSAIRGGDVRPPPSGSRVPLWLRQRVLRGLRAKPDERYPSMRAMLDALAPPTRWPALAVAIAVGVVAVVAVGFGIQRGGARLAAPGVSSPSSAPAEPVPTAVTDLPLPPSASVEAVSELRAAMQAYRDGTRSVRHFRRAVDLDPNLAPAYMRIALIVVQEEPDEARSAYRKATDLRSVMTDRDRVLLDAIEPYVARPHADFDELERRLARARIAYPRDAEFPMYIGIARSVRGDREAAIEAYDEALTIDPGFGALWFYRGQTLAYLGDRERSLDSLARCTALVPASNACHWVFAELSKQAGACAALEADTRAWLAADPESPLAYRELGNALYGSGRPLEAVEEALQKSVLHEQPSRRPKAELFDKIHVAVLRGRFDVAEASAQKLEEVAAADNVPNSYLAAARIHVAVLTESGRAKAAAALADGFLARRSAWAEEPITEDFAIANDITPVMLEAKLRGGLLDRQSFDAAREAWLHRAEASVPKWYASYLWLHGFAALARTKDEATAALAALPTYEPMRAFTPRTLADEMVGRVLLLGGKLGDAMPKLTRATESCFGIELPIEHTHAYAELGHAREANGDVAGACAAYRTVTERWGQAKPRSITAEDARERMRAIGCPP